MTEKREIKAIQLLLKGNNVKQLSRSNFRVRSQSNPKKWYRIISAGGRWSCDCKDHLERKGKCKHLCAVSYFLTLREVATGVRSFESNTICPKCLSNRDLVKSGYRYNQSGTVPRLYCKKCKHWLTERPGFEKMKNHATVVVAGLDLYFRGISLKQVAEHLQSSYGITVSYGTIYNWIRKYVELVSQYTEGLKPNTSERWHADETMVRLSGRQIVMWALLDSETRYLIAMHVSRRRDAHEAIAFLKKGVASANNRPLELVTDGNPSYEGAIEELNKGSETDEGKILHIKGPLVGKINNNKIERFNGTLKGRIRAMGQLNSMRGALTFTKGFPIYYDMIRSNEALKGRTPGQAAGIMKRKMNWFQLIRDASNHKPK